jgi:hypothetical protein
LSFHSEAAHDGQAAPAIRQDSPTRSHNFEVSSDSFSIQQNEMQHSELKTAESYRPPSPSRATSFIPSTTSESFQNQVPPLHTNDFAPMNSSTGLSAAQQPYEVRDKVNHFTDSSLVPFQPSEDPATTEQSGLEGTFSEISVSSKSHPISFQRTNYYFNRFLHFIQLQYHNAPLTHCCFI